MIPAEWFFSTLSQSMAAIVGFIVTIGAVLHQIDRNRRQRRTDRLREELIEFDDKYRDALNSVLEILKQPFSGDIPTDSYDLDEFPIHRLDETIHDEAENSYPISNEVWISSYQILKLLDSISPSQNLTRDMLLPPRRINEIENLLDQITDNILGDDASVQAEIRGVDAIHGEISASTNIFDIHSVGYPDLVIWFDEHLGESVTGRDLNGRNLLSIYRFFEEFHHDSKPLTRMTKNTIFDDETIVSNLLYPVLGLSIVGVFIPLLSLIFVPGSGPFISGWVLTIYQGFLLSISVLLTIVTIRKIWGNIRN